ncbi:MULTISPECIES: DUF3231 family protein [Paenibacillus]|uniref:DUF3231 family protein n=1 Tax=Paenibacillus TaxID=44249 RepID=UPI0022B9040F|nr:DUF3231 family protein [Paenibacillus caseinilyticus]MCZ8518199.1 DUF3231 family protein [Paenibacillus caseinilyticus]
MHKHYIGLTSGEVAPLWTGYLGDSMANRVLHYFLRKVEDEEIRPMIEYALSLTNEHMAFKDKLFRNEGIPIPVAFTDEDVRPDAPRLYSDVFTLLYIRQMGIAGMTAYGLALASSARLDVRDFFSHNLKTAMELYNKSATLLESKGVLPRPPGIPYPDTAEFVQKEGWLNGLLGDRRPLNIIEMTHLFMNIMTNHIGQALMQGFAQCTESKAVTAYLVRGRDIATKHVEVFSSLLRDDHLPAPETWQAEVTDSTQAPFSDKLMLYHAVSLAGMGIGNYGAAVAGSMRRDLASVYVRLMAEVGTYADDGAELMIRNEWLEKIPGAVERDVLIKR